MASFLGEFLQDPPASELAASWLSLASLGTGGPENREPVTMLVGESEDSLPCVVGVHVDKDTRNTRMSRITRVLLLYSLPVS